MSGQGRSDTHLRHCEARSAVAIHVPVPRRQWIASFLAMPGQARNDGAGAPCRRHATLYARRIFRPMTILSP